MGKKPIVVGIDPGTTTAIAFLDSKGKPMEVKSSKKYSKEMLISEIREKGSPMIIGTDKNPLPSSIKDVSTEFKCELNVPEEDLSRGKKSNLTKQYKDMIDNEHEKDALAAAIQAYKSYKKQLRKIKRRNPDKYEEVVRKKLLGINERNQKDRKEINEKVKINPLEKEHRKEIKNLKEKLKKLKNRLKSEKKEKRELQKHLKDLKIGKGIKERENYLKSKIKKLEHEKNKLKDKINEIIELMDREEIKKMTEEELEKEKYTQSKKKFKELKEKGKEAYLVKVIYERFNEDKSKNEVYYKEIDRNEPSGDTLRRIIDSYKKSRK